MASPRLSASMLLASLILLLYWTASSARSHDLSPPYRLKRDLPFEARAKAEASVTLAKEILTSIKEKIDSMDTKKLSGVLKAIEKVASLGPGIGSLVSAIVNVVLIAIPENDPVLNEVKKGFSEMNRKLDSLSIQISNLATDVEWFNYASVYSQDERRILNTWAKFEELYKNSQLTQSEDDRLRLAEIFANYYEYTGTEASVANLYHYLTVQNTSLSRNLNELLRKKFKCDIETIGRYNIYFGTLLWKGMVLTQFHWKLIGFNSLVKERDHAEMSKTVYTAQMATVDFCLDRYEEYMKADVEEIAKGLSNDNKKAIADQVKAALDKKYFWYNWVVLVYDTASSANHVLHNMIQIPAYPVTVAVSPTEKAEGDVPTAEVEQLVERCFMATYLSIQPIPSLTIDTPCETFRERIPVCDNLLDDTPVRDHTKVMHTTYGDAFVQVPEPLKPLECHEAANWYRSKIYLFYSRSSDPCAADPCDDRDQCQRVLGSSEHLCRCPDGYRRETCEVRKEPDVPAIEGLVVPDITTISAKLKLMEDKLETILTTLKNTCPAQ